MAQPGTPPALSDRRWVILSVVAVAQLMVVLDAFTGEQMSFGAFELAAPCRVDRVCLAELMIAAADREVIAEDLPAGFTLPRGQPDGLGGMFAEYDRHGFHGGNQLVLRAILQRAPRTVASYIAELGAARLTAP
jgi:hypothetical protein